MMQLLLNIIIKYFFKKIHLNKKTFKIYFEDINTHTYEKLMSFYISKSLPPKTYYFKKLFLSFLIKYLNIFKLHVKNLNILFIKLFP